MIFSFISVNLRAQITTNDSCHNALPFCGSGLYSFAAGVSPGWGTDAQSGPNYGCLSSQPNPAWYFMQIGTPGDIVIQMQSTPSRDIDFICWGPFTSPTNACVSGLSFGKIVDCSYSTSSTEICTISSAPAGAFYMLLITNYSNLPCGVTFSQTNYGMPGAGTTNCDIVINCSIITLSAVPGFCNIAGGYFNVSGVVEFANSPPGGQLTITDITAIPPVSKVFNAPFTSPQNYVLPNVPCDGLSHTITAAFSDSLTCTYTQTYNAPTNLCPVAVISGGGIVCNNGIDYTTVSINITQGSPPYNFTYAINGTPRPPVNNYSGSLPYVINTMTPGTYTLVSVSNAMCSGTVSGSAVVTLQPPPVPVITGSAQGCIGTTGNVYSTQPGMSNYTWFISGGGTITSGAGTNSITVTWNSTGAQFVSVSYTDAALCTAAVPSVFNVNVNTLPVPTITGPSLVCANSTGNTYSTQPGMTNYSWVVSPGGTITAGGTAVSDFVTVTWNTSGARSVSAGFTDLNGCMNSTPVIFPVTVTPSMPVSVSIAAIPSGAICTGTAVTFTATPVNGGASPTYQWKKGGVNIPGEVSSTYSTSTLLNGDILTVEMVSNAGCPSGSPALSNSITAVVNPLLPVSVSITASPATATCPGTNVIFTATPVNGGTAPTYQWRKGGVNIPGATGPVYATNTLVNGDVISVEMTSNATCPTGSPALSNNLTMTVNPFLPASVSITVLPAVAVCPGTNVTFTATPVNGGAAPAYQWMKGGVDIPGATGVTYSTTTLLNGEIISVRMTSNATPCLINSPAISNTISAQILPSPVPSVTGPVIACQDATGNLYSSQPGMINYTWTISPGGLITSGGGLNDPNVTVTWTSSGARSVSVNYQSAGGCMAASPGTLAVNVNPKPVVTNVQRNFLICSGTGTNITLQSSLPSTTYSWTTGTISTGLSGFSNGTGAAINQLLTNSATTVGSLIYTVTPLSNGCSGDGANFTVSVNPVPNVIFSPANPAICSGQMVSITLNSSTPGTMYTWTPVSHSPLLTGQTAGSGNVMNQFLTNPEPTPGTVDYEVQPTISGCNGTPATITIVVNPIPAVSFRSCQDLNTTKNARRIILKGGMPIGSGGQYSGPGVSLISAGVFAFDPADPSIIPSFTGNDYVVTYRYTNSFGCFDEDISRIKVFLSNAAQPCPGSLTDVRDNVVYQTFLSGTGPGAKCWMAENLNYGTAIILSQNAPQRENCIVEKYCADNNLAQCSALGGFYQWDELMQYYAVEGGQGICPPGWHVPSRLEWEDLINNNQGAGLAGDPLKNLLAANNFHGNLNGLYYLDQQWSFNSGTNRGSMFWTSSSSASQTAFARGLNSTNQSVSLYNSSRANAFNVRCVKD